MFGLLRFRRPDERLGRAIRVGLELFQIDGNQGIRWECLTLRFPIHIGRKEQLAVYQAIGRCFERHVEAQPLAVFLPEVFGFVEAGCAECIRAMYSAGMIAQQRCSRPNVGFLAAPDFFGLVDGRSAFPNACGPWILAFRECAFTEIAADEQCILVQPLDAALAFLIQDKAAIDEGLGRHIEFAKHGGVLAAVG